LRYPPDERRRRQGERLQLRDRERARRNEAREKCINA
jgi:hypothetical protein